MSPQMASRKQDPNGLADQFIDCHLRSEQCSRVGEILQHAEVPLELGQAPRALQTSSVAWDNKIVGRLWIIRPDELPLGPVHTLPY